MAFRFSLAPVLRYRQSREDQERLRLQALYTRRAALARELEQTREAWQRSHRSVRQHLQQGLALAVEFQFCTASLAGSERRQQQLRAGLLQLQPEIAAATQRYHQERQKRELLESLRDLQFSEYRLQQRRREQAALDELHLLRRYPKRA